MGIKQEQVLLLDPPTELRFKGPFKEVVTSHLKITNPTDQQICFKVKTTAPKQYCVRPNSGMLEPKQSQTVAVMLQPMDIATVDRSKHKFMVQSLVMPEGGDVKLEDIWKTVKKDELMDSKLRCVFDEPDPVKVDADSSLPLSTPKQEAPQNRAGSTPGVISEREGATVGDSERSSEPVTTAQEESELSRAQLEAKARCLQNEVDRLTSQNNELKADSDRLRMRHTQQHNPATGSTPKSAGAKSPARSSSPNLVLIAVIIMIALMLGYFVGKQL